MVPQGIEYFPYQPKAIDFVVQRKYSALWLDMGLGKTLITLSAIAEWLDTGEARKVLIVAPKRVAEHTWTTEIMKFGFDFRVASVMGTRKQRYAAAALDAELYIINYENLVWLLNAWKKEWPYDTVILDEASAFKNASAKRFKTLRRTLPYIQRIVELTGTPAPNGLHDLWAPMFLLDRGERLGRTLTEFRDRWFDHDPYRYTYTPKKEAATEIYGKLRGVAMSLRKKDYLDLPPKIFNTIPVRLPTEARSLYKDIHETLVLEWRDKTTILNPVTLANKAQQAANGIMYVDEDRTPMKLHDAKFDALREVIDSHLGQSVMVAYWFRSELDELLLQFPHGQVLRSGDDADRWNRREVPLMFVQPASAKFGLNLQKGGHILVWFSLTWSSEAYRQLNDRLQRPGQDRAVMIHHLVARGTVDERMLRVMRGKTTVEEELLNAVKEVA